MLIDIQELNYRRDLNEYELLKQIIDDSNIIFSKKASEDLIDFHNRIKLEYLFSKGFTIDYCDNLESVGENLSITKLKKKEGKLESIVLDENNNFQARLIINGDKNLSVYFKDKKIEPIYLEFEKTKENKSNLVIPRFQYAIKIISEIGKYVYENQSKNSVLIPDVTYFKMSSDHFEFDTRRKNQAYLDILQDPKGDLWSIFLMKQEDKSIDQPFLKGYKKYRVLNL